MSPGSKALSSYAITTSRCPGRVRPRSRYAPTDSGQSCGARHRGEHWTFGLEAFGVRLDTAEEALRPGGEIGERVPVGLDLEWEAPNVVLGDVLVGRERWTIDARGWFYEDGMLPPPVAGDVQTRVIIPGVAERALVRTEDGLRWTSLG